MSYRFLKDTLPRPDDDELREMDEQIGSLGSKFQQLKDQVKAAESGKTNRAHKKPTLRTQSGAVEFVS